MSNEATKGMLRNDLSQQQRTGHQSTGDLPHATNHCSSGEGVG